MPRTASCDAVDLAQVSTSIAASAHRPIWQPSAHVHAAAPASTSGRTRRGCSWPRPAPAADARSSSSARSRGSAAPLTRDGASRPATIAEVAAIVAAQRAAARGRRARRRARRRDGRDPRGPRTATRSSPRCASARASPSTCSTATTRARLAFAGATRTLERPPAGTIAVVDVGGSSTEIAVGTMAAGVAWSRSFAIGSGLLAGALPRRPAVGGRLDAMRAPPRRVRRRGRAAARARGRGRRQRRFAAALVGPLLDARRSSARSPCCAPHPAAEVAARHGLPPSACGCCRRAYWCSTRPPSARHCRCGSAAAGCARAWSSSWRSER